MSKSQWLIDAGNLRFYAEQAEFENWHTAGYVINSDVIAHTLRSIADRIDKQQEGSDETSTYTSNTERDANPSTAQESAFDAAPPTPIGEGQAKGSAQVEAPAVCWTLEQVKADPSKAPAIELIEWLAQVANEARQERDGKKGAGPARICPRCGHESSKDQCTMHPLGVGQATYPTVPLATQGRYEEDSESLPTIAELYKLADYIEKRLNRCEVDINVLADKTKTVLPGAVTNLGTPMPAQKGEGEAEPSGPLNEAQVKTINSILQSPVRDSDYMRDEEETPTQVWWEYVDGEELAIFWNSPYGHGKEKIATFWWPIHPPENTRDVELAFEVIASKLGDRGESAEQEQNKADSESKGSDCYGSSAHSERSPSQPGVLDDGFGNYWSKVCSECGKETMQIVRPGDARCTNCDSRVGMGPSQQELDRAKLSVIAERESQEWMSNPTGIFHERAMRARVEAELSDLQARLAASERKSKERSDIMQMLSLIIADLKGKLGDSLSKSQVDLADLQARYDRLDAKFWPIDAARENWKKRAEIADAERDRLASDVNELRQDIERRDVQLAGCLVAAEGGTGKEVIAERYSYGWSPAYQATLDLRIERDRLAAEVDEWKSIVRNRDKSVNYMSKELAEVKTERDLLADSHRELLIMLKGMLELENKTHRIPESINSEWLNGVVSEAKAAIAKAEALTGGAQ